MPTVCGQFPALATHVLPYFLNGERLLVGVAMDQLQPAALTGGFTFRPGAGGPGNPHPALLIPPMPTWAMWAVIVGWIVGWSAIGAWRMATPGGSAASASGLLTERELGVVRRPTGVQQLGPPPKDLCRITAHRPACGARPRTAR